MKTLFQTFLDLLCVAALLCIALGKFAWIAVTNPRQMAKAWRSDFGEEND